MRLPRLRSILLVPILLTITIGFAVFALYVDRFETSNRTEDLDAELVRAERSFEALPAEAAPPGVPPPGELPPGEVPPGELAPGVQNQGPPAGSIVDAVGDEVALADDVDAPIQLLVDFEGQVLVDSGQQRVFDQSTLTSLAGRRGSFTVESPRYRVRISLVGDNAVQITGLSLEQFDEVVSELRQMLLVAGISILLLEAAVVWLFAGRLVQPVAAIATTATQIADGDLDTQITPSGSSREIAELATDLERMVAQLRTVIAEREGAAAEATEARDDMQRFLADASHELRTPLTALKGYSDLYAGNMLEEPGALDRAMSRIGDESERLTNLVTDMLALAREAPSADLSEKFDVAETVLRVVEDLSAAHPEMQIGFAGPAIGEAMAFGHPHRLHQAVLNVGSNACQHTDPDRGVQFDLRVAGSTVVVDVIDHGPGVDPAEVDKIFLPFYRPQSARGRSGRSGAGLGLAITEKILDLFGGSVEVGATPGGGATMTLSIPLAAD